MKQRNFRTHGLKQITGLLVLLIALSSGLALAQGDGQDADLGWTSEIRENIRQHSGLDEAQREQMMANLDRCLDQGLSADQVQTLFPAADFADQDRAQYMLAHQNRILGVGEAGLPMEPMMEKMREGRMKRVRPQMMDRVLAQTDHNIRIADRVMRETIAGGVRPAGRNGEMSDAVVDLSRCLWDGLQEQDMEHLGENARLRARDGGCGLDEFVAANQAATRFAQSGVDREHAVNMAAEAMHNGYSAQDMRTMGDMMMTSAHMDGDHQTMMDSMDDWIHEGVSMDEMTEHMMDGGWMGPADMMGPGGHHPMNDMGMGGAGHDGGMGGDHDHGGMGGGMGGDDGHH